MPTLVSLQVMLMHPRRRVQVIAGAFVIFCILSYVIISPSSSHNTNNTSSSTARHEQVKEIFAPGPTKDYADFDYRLIEPVAAKSSSIKSKKLEEEVITKRRIQDRPTQSRRNNVLNGVPIGKNLDDFDVIGGADLFRAQGHPEDDR